MNELSELDLQNLRHLIGGFDTTHCKMTAYAHMLPALPILRSNSFSRNLHSPRCSANSS